MRYGARNQMTATVTDIKKDQVMCQVGLTADGPLQLSSVMTCDSLADLGLKSGDRVRVIVKAIHVLVVKE